MIYSPQNSCLAKKPCFCCSLPLLWFRLVFPLYLSQGNFKMLDLDTILSSFPAQSLQGKLRDLSVVRACRQESSTGHLLLQPCDEPPPRGCSEWLFPYRSVQAVHFCPSFPPCPALNSKIPGQFRCYLYPLISKTGIQFSKRFAVLNEAPPASALPEGWQGLSLVSSDGHSKHRSMGGH